MNDIKSSKRSILDKLVYLAKILFGVLILIGLIPVAIEKYNKISSAKLGPKDEAFFHTIYEWLSTAFLIVVAIILKLCESILTLITNQTFWKIALVVGAFLYVQTCFDKIISKLDEITNHLKK